MEEFNVHLILPDYPLGLSGIGVEKGDVLSFKCVTKIIKELV